MSLPPLLSHPICVHFIVLVLVPTSLLILVVLVEWHCSRWAWWQHLVDGGAPSDKGDAEALRLAERETEDHTDEHEQEL
jgi:cytochrome oxidase assembly protein ShyY1